MDLTDCGSTCLKMISKHYDKDIDLDYLRKLTHQKKIGISFQNLMDASESIGFDSLPVNINLEQLENEVPLPCIAHWKEQHFIVVYSITKKFIYVADPAFGLIKYNRTDFKKGWLGDSSISGNILIIEPGVNFYKLNSTDELLSNKGGLVFLKNYFKPHKKYIYQLILGLFVGTIIQFIFPFLTQSIVDYGIDYENLKFIYIILIAQIVLFISQTSVELIRSWILLHITLRININIINDFLVKLMKLPITYFDSKNTGDIMKRIYDHERIEEFLSSTILNTMFSVFNIVIFSLILFYYNYSIFLIFFFGSIIYIGWSILFLKKRAKLDFLEFESSSNNTSVLLQLISGMQEIKLNNSEKRRRFEWKKIQIDLFDITSKQMSLSQKQIVGSKFINELKNILITFVSASAVISGELTLGIMIAIQYIIGQLNLPLSNLVTFLQVGQDAKLSIDRLKEIHNKKDESNIEINYAKPKNELEDILISNLSFKYGGRNEQLVLNDLSLNIPKGKTTAIVGTSGSGKTTLLKILLKFYSVPGTIKIGNHFLENLSTKDWRNQCGVVMQNGFIFNDTILRNITESDSNKAPNLEKLNIAIDVANLKDLIDELPLGINTKIGNDLGINLSGGEKQRILIARAIYKNPKYLIFDEATSSLDTINENIISNNLKNFLENRTAIIVAHRLSTVKNADNIIVLDNGNIVESGTHKSLIKNGGFYFNLIKNQLELNS